MLCGTTIQGGSSWNSGPAGLGYGTVFTINTDGTGFQTLYNFGSGIDGAAPFGGVVLSGNTLYGPAEAGGNPGGALFSITADGTGFNALYDFTTPNETNSDGASPYAGLVLSGNALFGVTQNGGTSGLGVVFRINTDGTGFATLHSFTAGDGTGPFSELVLSGNTLYGTAGGGGRWGNGTIYTLSTDGTGFTNFYSFTATSGYYPANADGASPNALVLSGATLYGTAAGGGARSSGTVFALNTDGTGFRLLHTFTARGLTLPGQPWPLNSDGFGPTELILSGNRLYGVAKGGGSSGDGTVFSLNTNGTGFTTLHSFSTRDSAWINTDGWIPAGRPVVSGNVLYGTAHGGGAFGYGTLFSISLPVPQPQLTISGTIGSVVLTWPTNAVGFTLESSTNLGSPASWTAVSAMPIVINGQNTVTNPISGGQQFYRLSQ
jgi:uncharacterized repeat protein (TIGR03803 family)